MENFKFETPEPVIENEFSVEEAPLSPEDAEMIVLNYQAHAAEFGLANPAEFDRIIAKLKNGEYSPQEAIDQADALAPHEVSE